MKNLREREGYKNRNIDGMPDQACLMNVIHEDHDGEIVFKCKWHPFDRQQHTKDNIPENGYFGTAVVIEGRLKGIGFHAWDQNNSEFIWYSLIED